VALQLFLEGEGVGMPEVLARLGRRPSHGPHRIRSRIGRRRREKEKGEFETKETRREAGKIVWAEREQWGGSEREPGRCSRNSRRSLSKY